VGFDRTTTLQQMVQQAVTDKQTLRIIGGGSKSFYGRAADGQKLEVAEHRGVIRYEPTELVVTVRSGTPVRELERILAEHGQMLPFDPPCFSASSTVGGMIASGLAGPRRPWCGALRDAVLGLRCINGRAEVLQFGGEVVKNVAGFDVSRLMVGAMGTLGVILDVSLKLIPRPECEQSFVFDGVDAEALAWVREWTSQGLPLSGAVLDGRRLIVRLSGSDDGVRAAAQCIGGQRFADREAGRWWRNLRDYKHDFFADQRSLWRLSVPVSAPPINILGDWLYDWGGAQRWLKTALQSTIIREMVVRAGGHATMFRGGDRQGMVFHPLSPAVYTVHKSLKKAFDPHGLFNHGVLYPDI